MSDTNEITSIWDGWERQIVGLTRDDKGGFCAMGWIYSQTPNAEGVDAGTVARVGKFIQRTMNPPESYKSTTNAFYPYSPTTSACHAVIWANNVLRLTPEQFREIDRLTQVEAVSKPLIESVEIAVGVSA